MSLELTNAKDYISWLYKKSNLNALSANAKNRNVSRGQVYWCEFGVNIGSEMSKLTPRPAVIVQNFTANRNSSNTIVIPITSDTGRLSCLVPITTISDQNSKIILTGQANTSNIVCVSKARLKDKICDLSAIDMKKIDESIAISLSLIHYHKSEVDKYEKLSKYNDKVKNDRNIAQDKLKMIQETVLKLNSENIDNIKNNILEILDK